MLQIFERRLDCRLIIDIPREGGEPKPGEYVVTVGKTGAVGSAYLIVSVRKVAQRKTGPSQRFALQCHRAELRDVGEPCWCMRWYARRKRLRLPGTRGATVARILEKS